jgi:[ribosomal protein S5]-alanine N-acetyltransferase
MDVILKPGSVALFDADASHDLSKLAALLGVDQIEEWPPVGGEHDADAVVFFRSQVEQDSAAHAWVAHYVVADNKLAGSAGFFGPPQDGVLEIGYSVCVMYRRRGIATSTVRALITLAKASNATSLTARVRPDNDPSIGVLQRNGFTLSVDDSVDGRKNDTVDGRADDTADEEHLLFVLQLRPV